MAFYDVYVKKAQAEGFRSRAVYKLKEIDDKGKATGGHYYFIDCLDNTPEYLVYENKQIKINKL
jgi:hypothetical protein